MAAAVRSRLGFDGAALRKLARASRAAKQVRRLSALAAIYHGETRSEAARIGGVTFRIVRDWVVPNGCASDYCAAASFIAEVMGGGWPRPLEGQNIATPALSSR